MRWDRIIEQKIREAQAQGKFDDLRGKGQPLNLDENPFEDPAWQAANQLLKGNGFRPEWLEEDAALREKLAQARRALARTRDWRAEQLAALGARMDVKAVEQRGLVEDEWTRALARFREALAEVNKGITRLNLRVPSPRFQRLKLDVEAEALKVVNAA
jgi:hypothetical protein